MILSSSSHLTMAIWPVVMACSEKASCSMSLSACPCSFAYPEQHNVLLRISVSTVDLFATILHLADAENPGETEGRSLLPCMTGESDIATDVFIEHKDDCVIRGDVKLITKRNENEITHCFDLADDPYERNNLTQSLNSETRDSMLLALNQWRNRTRS